MATQNKITKEALVEEIDAVAAAKLDPSLVETANEEEIKTDAPDALIDLEIEVEDGDDETSEDEGTEEVAEVADEGQESEDLSDVTASDDEVLVSDEDAVVKEEAVAKEEEEVIDLSTEVKEEAETEVKEEDPELAAKEGLTEEEIDALTKDEDSLSEGFKAKAAVIFEATLNKKLKSEKARLQEHFEVKLNEAVKSNHSDLVEKIDSYLVTVVESWVKENQVAIDSGLRNEISENFIAALGKTFRENFIEVPEAKADLAEQLQVKASSLEESVASEKKKVAALKADLAKFQKAAVISEACKSLTSIQAAKLVELSEGTSFEDEASFSKKVSTLKESFFRKEGASQVVPAPQNLTEKKTVSFGSVDAVAAALAKTL